MCHHVSLGVISKLEAFAICSNEQDWKQSAKSHHPDVAGKIFGAKNGRPQMFEEFLSTVEKT